MHVYGAEQGEKLVKAARNAIELSIINPYFDSKIVKKNLKEFEKQHGVFVTLEHYPTMSLRGCIGFPRAVEPLGESIVNSAIAAAFEDPRFVSVSERELDELIVEVSILSNPVKVDGNSRRRMDSIKVGRDGLLIEYGLHSGLLLPVVAVQYNMSKKSFLEAVCEKAGIHTDYWAQPNVKLYKFETQVFREETPRGKVIEVKGGKI